MTSPAASAANPRRIPAPRWEPPYDDSHSVPVEAPAPAQGTLALAFQLPGGLPARPEAPARLRLLQAPSDDYEDPHFAPQATPRCALPDPRAWSGRFVQALLEVLNGGRPAAQLVRWTSSDIYSWVQRRAATLPPTTRRGARPLVRSVRVCEPGDGVAEVSAVVQSQRRVVAIALRLEGIDGRWQCTVLEMG